MLSFLTVVMHFGTFAKNLFYGCDVEGASEDIDIWYCEYAEVPSFYYQFSMWQYTESGHVDGIDGNVDLNISFKNTADYAK